MLAMVSPETLVIVILAVIVVFGGSRIPHLARSLGQAKSEFQKGLREDSTAETDEGSAHRESGEKPESTD